MPTFTDYFDAQDYVIGEGFRRHRFLGWVRGMDIVRIVRRGETWLIKARR